MTLVDTSVWIEYFRTGNARLAGLLEEDLVVLHPMILGELACGNLPQRAETLLRLENLAQVKQAPDYFVRQTIESQRWFAKSIGWVDAHVLVASLLANMSFWTLDQRIQSLAERGLNG